ncbi:MAG: DUF72 domain-containing protein [Saprospiraceae bacterium]
MKFGKLPDISRVDFSLPPDSPGTQRVLQQWGGRSQPLAVYIGCTGWSMSEWVGKVYPKGTKSKDFLYHYSRQFNTIEFNTTHYRIPDVATIRKWYEQSAEDFKFCPKIPQTISHSRNLGLGGDQIPAFCEAIQGLEEKLGCCFMQLPPYFGPDRMRQLETFVAAFPKHIPLAIELRQADWFDNPTHSSRLFDMLEAHQKATVITDVAGRRDVLHMRLTNSVGMVRFVGNDLVPSDYSRVDTWIERINQWQVAGLSELYFFTHEPDNLKAPELAQYMFEKLKDTVNIATRGPSFYSADEGEQMSLF